MKQYLVKFLKWALSKFEPEPTLKEHLTAWPFPKEAPKAKATPRPVAKKATTVAKKTTKKVK